MQTSALGHSGPRTFRRHGWKQDVSTKCACGVACRARRQTMRERLKVEKICEDKALQERLNSREWLKSRAFITEMSCYGPCITLPIAPETPKGRLLLKARGCRICWSGMCPIQKLRCRSVLATL